VAQGDNQVLDGSIISVVEMRCQDRCGDIRADSLDHLEGLFWSTNANGVTKRYLITSELLHQLGDSCHLLGVYLSLIRASHDTRDVPSDLDIVGSRHFHHLLKPCQTFIDGALDVLLCESFTGSTEDCNLFHATFKSSLHSFHIGDKNRVVNSIDLGDASEDFRTIG
jgi:hypothetical protein